ncbi:MAG: hypothetical protein HY350_02720, partial [Candidatus Omnitrophica bacterium]|nr:hypothetical protein [Candidatus Omnitrophota bacterium]
MFKQKLLYFMRPYRNGLILGLLLTLLLTFLNLPMPVLIKIFIDNIVGEGRWEWLGWMLFG